MSVSTSSAIFSNLRPSDDQMLDSSPVLVDRITIASLTLGVSLTDCTSRLPQTLSARLYDKISRVAGGFSQLTRDLATFYGIDVLETRLTTTPLSILCDGYKSSELVSVASILDRAAADSEIDAVVAAAVYEELAWTAGAREVLKALPTVIGGTTRLRAAAVSWSDDSVPQEGLAATAAAIASVGALTDRERSHDASRICAAHFPTRSAAENSGLYHPAGAADVSVSVEVSGEQAFSPPLAGMQNGREVSMHVAKALSRKLVRAGRFFASRFCTELRRLSGVEARPGRIQLCLLPRPNGPREGAGSESTTDSDTTELRRRLGQLTRAIDDGARSAGGSGGIAYRPTTLQRSSDPLSAIRLLREAASAAWPLILYPRVAIDRSTPAETISRLQGEYLEFTGVRGPGGLISLVPSGET